MVAALIETTVFVDLLRSYPPALTWLQRQPQSASGITPIIWMEVIAGGTDKTRRIQAARLMSRFEMVYVT